MKHASSNGCRTEWGPVPSVVIQVISKWESNLLITSMITDRIGQHKVLLPINQNYDKIKERNNTFVLHFYNKKKPVNSPKCKAIVCAHNVFCPLTQA